MDPKEPIINPEFLNQNTESKVENIDNKKDIIKIMNDFKEVEQEDQNQPEKEKQIKLDKKICSLF